MNLPFAVSSADRRLLPEGRFAGPMPWVIAIMMFLTVLAGAGGLGLRRGAQGLVASIGERLTVQIVEANPDIRDAQARAAMAMLQRRDGVLAVNQVGAAEMTAMLTRVLGSSATQADLPIPAMIDVDLSPAAYRERDAITADLRAVAPAARVDDNATWLSPLANLLGSLKWLALALVVLMTVATAAAVVLAARGALDTHRGTIEVMHLMGSTDYQIARLFQRRIALDALFGGALGFVAGVVVLIGIGHRVGAVGSDLLGSARLAAVDWLLLLALPLAGIGLAMLVARMTVLRALRKML